MTETLVPLGLMAMVVLIVWFSHASKRKARDRKAEIVRQLIERFSSGEAFADAIRGPEGAALAEALALDDNEPSKVAWKGLMVGASVMTFLGAGFLVLTWTVDGNFLTPAVVVGAIGLALALSSYVIWRSEDGRDDSPAHVGETGDGTDSEPRR